MPLTNKKGDKKLFTWLRTQKANAIVPYENVLEVTGWNETTLKTYISKNKIAPFLSPLENRKLKVLMDGRDIDERYFHETFTQTAPRQLTLSAGQKLSSKQNKYELIESLGNGAIADVWSARITNCQQRKVAVKVMLPHRRDLLQASKLPDVRERFSREAQNGQKLDHKNIVQYLDTGEINGNPFLVMELADCSIGAKLKSNGPFSPREAAKIIRCCTEGLRYLHNKKCLHRDIKPDNILWFPDAIKLGDLGIVRWSDFDPTFVSGGTITKESVQLGSWFYMAPEQLQSPHDAVNASDIYALGITWIEILTKSVPAPRAIADAYYKLPSDIEPDIVTIIKKMHSLHSEERPSIDDILHTISGAYMLD